MDEKRKAVTVSGRSGWALLGALTGMGVWALCFVVLYGGLSLGCTYGWSDRSIGPFNVITLALMLAWTLHLAVLGWMTWAAWRARQAGRAPSPHDPYGTAGQAPFILTLNWILHLLALLALVPLAVPVLVLSPCA